MANNIDKKDCSTCRWYDDYEFGGFCDEHEKFVRREDCCSRWTRKEEFIFDCDTCAYRELDVDEEPCNSCYYLHDCRYEPIEKEGEAKKNDN